MEFEDFVVAHYKETTEELYIDSWNPNHFHFGLFKPGECPDLDPSKEQRYSSFIGIDKAAQRMIDVVVAPAMIGPDSHVVDAGCGVGGTAFRLADMGGGCQVTGINISEKQLEIANGKLKKNGLGNRVSFKYGNCSKYLPFADDSVDVVVNIESACHYADRQKFLREVFRILKPGGKIVAEDWMAVDSITKQQYEQYIQPLCESWAMLSLERQSGYVRKLEDAGLSILEFEDFSGMDLDNLIILENLYTNLFSRYLNGNVEPEFLTNFQRFANLYIAWKEGYFELRRYCAQKPG